MIFFLTFITTLFAILYALPVYSLPIQHRGDGSFKGQGTYYTIGLGSCGKTNRDSDMVVALSSSMMSSGKYCGKKIKAKSSKGTVTATVADTCPGCPKDDIDFSMGAFKLIGSIAAGRIDISWEFE